MLDDGFRIRTAGEEDVSAIVGLSGDLFREDAGRRDAFTNINWPAEEGEEYFAGLIGSDHDFCLIARSAEEAIGYLAARVGEPASLRPVRVADIESIYVSKPYRSTGLGQKLAGEFMRIAGERGAQRISVTAYASNERAITFYEKLGFSPRSISFERDVE